MNLFSRKFFLRLGKNILGIPKSIPCTLVEDLRLIALSSVVAKAQEFSLFGGYMTTLLGKFLIPNMVAYRDHLQLMP